MTDLMICAKCGEPLKIVCDAHGVDFVPDRRMQAAPVESARHRPHTSALKRGEVVATLGSLRFQLFAALSTDPLNPSTPAALAETLGRPHANVGIDLAILAKEGRIQRVGRGLYCRPS